VKKRIQLDPSWTLLHQPNAGYPHAPTEVEPQVFLAEIIKPITKPMLESSFFISRHLGEFTNPPFMDDLPFKIQHFTLWLCQNSY